MVNKVAVALVGGFILVGVLVIGGVFALLLGGGGSAGEATPTFVDETPLPSPTPTAAATGTATVTPTATSTRSVTRTQTPTETARPTVPASDFDERTVEHRIAVRINERRRAADLDPLELDGSLVGEVSEMARDHSEAMATAGEVTHGIDGNNSADRYRQAELYENCKWVKPGEEGFAVADANGLETSENGFEAVAGTVAGRVYDAEFTDASRFNADESDVAEAVVQTWWHTTVPPYSQRLTLPNARYLGVGVEITQDGQVYATANLC
jgi:uncharacterized protein YkwD